MLGYMCRTFNLENLKVQYQLFKSTHPSQKIGFSKFAELHPKNCILAGISGTHAVCLCTKHQNVKSIMSACKLGVLLKETEEAQSISYRVVLAKTMCNPQTTMCDLNEYVSCPDIDNLKNSMMHRLHEEMINNVTYKQWISVDRCALEAITKSSEYFIDSFCEQIEVMNRHYFISQQQSPFLL